MILVPEEDAAMDAASARAPGRGREPPGAGAGGAGGAEHGASPAQAAAPPAHAKVPEQTRGALAPGPTGTSTSSTTTTTTTTTLTTRPAGAEGAAAATNASAGGTTDNAGKVQDLDENEIPEANMKKSGPVATVDKDDEKDHALGVMPRHGDENRLERRQERTATESTMVDMDAEDEPCVESVPTSSDADTDRQGRRSSDATIMSESEEEMEEDVQAIEKFSVGKDKKSFLEQGGRTEGTLSDHASGDAAQANGGSTVADGSRRGSKSRSNSGRSAGGPAGPAAIELLDAVLEQETADADAGAGSPAALKFNSPAMSQSTLREVDMASVRTSESTATFASGYSESTEGERTPTESTVKIGFETDSAMMKLLSRGIRIFNLNPKRGIEFIQANDLVHRVPNDDAGNARRIAIFLRHTRGLNKEQIGKVLGGENPQQIAILKYYFVQFDLSEYGPTVRGLERALRSVFECFKPPGESQKIERIVETFADKFNEDNRMIGAEPNPDAEFLPTTTFLLSYSIILLNVDLHNPNNPRKMLRREFISNLRGLDDGKDLPHEALSALYDRMSRHQMRHKVDRDEVAGDLFTHPDKAGWLQKKGPTRLSKWRPRWFILSESTLWYFKHSEDVDPQGFIPLENVLIRTCFDVPAPRGAAAARSSAAPKTGVPQATAASVSTTASTLPTSPMPPRQVASVGGATAAAPAGKASVAAAGNASKTSGILLSATTSASSSTSSSSSSTMSSSSKTCPVSPKPLAENGEKACTGDSHPPTAGAGIGAGAASLFPSGSGATGPASRLARPLSMPLSAVPPDLMYSSEDEASTPGSAKTSSGSGRRLVSRKSATMRFLPGSNPNSPTAASASSASRQTRSRNFWFEMYMWDDRLNVKSARLSKRTGNFELGQHRTIKLRADSRQEMEQWVELLNRKGRFSQSLQDLTMRARFEQQLHPPRSFAGTPGPKTPNSHAHRKGMHAVSSSPSVPTTPPIAPRLRSSRSSFFRAVFSSSRASSGTDSRPSSPNCMSQPGDLASSEEDLLAVNEHINRASSVASAPTV